MEYTTHGLMSPADVADHRGLTDTARNPECPGHPDDGDWMWPIYCTVAMGCPNADEEADEWGPPPGQEPW